MRQYILLTVVYVSIALYCSFGIYLVKRLSMSNGEYMVSLLTGQNIFATHFLVPAIYSVGFIIIGRYVYAKLTDI